ncbi:hypothetical protein [Streptomyces sp. WMMC1477]|uniref:hypothetical protein n=1 Tax=Streptomyces sp. WMMC1477 TaxID=3015155 RepID=UPI0022B69E41|nr:hypothetical protein [Streptomyces sp. WMMC1477]MCZ7430155.1 hypothetical protein [Streptomyces sp. WMMC1477]
MRKEAFFGKAKPPLGDQPPRETRERSIPEAAVFIRRKSGKTEPAKASDIDRLSERLKRGHDLLDIDLHGTEGGITPITIPDTDLDEWLEAEEGRLLASAPSPPAPAGNALEAAASLRSLMAQAASLDEPDPRTRQQYLSEVRTYMGRLRAAIPLTMAEVAGMRAARLQLTVENRTRSNLADVQVELEIPDHVAAVLPDEEQRGWRPEALPKPPRPYGPTPRHQFPQFSALSHFDITPAGSMYEEPEITETPQGVLVRFPAVDLRPERGADLEPIVLFTKENSATHEVTLRWHATSTSTNGSHSEDLAVPLLPAQSLLELIRRPPPRDV